MDACTQKNELLREKFDLQRLSRHKAIQAQPPFLNSITQEDKRRRLLAALLGTTGIEYVMHI